MKTKFQMSPIIQFGEKRENMEAIIRIQMEIMDLVEMRRNPLKQKFYLEKVTNGMYKSRQISEQAELVEEDLRQMLITMYWAIEQLKPNQKVEELDQ